MAARQESFTTSNSIYDPGRDCDANLCIRLWDGDQSEVLAGEVDELAEPLLVEHGAAP